MEQALFIEDVVELEDLHPDYGRIYFGEEFCGRRLASPETYRRVAERCRSMGNGGFHCSMVSASVMPSKSGVRLRSARESAQMPCT